ncbi:rootletin isoform X2 [Frankliniella occidentalis]|uniref:Rootletin isoform X2 n=1 Tax=Frankliniella occidentalis TaxID=133901 RepID=A0A6J1SIC4_FRAOC|nr:rootletin isoform X2 [Frankliniella occidentalis]
MEAGRERSRDRERSPARSPARSLGAAVADAGAAGDVMLRQNREMRRRMEEEQASYRRRLDTYRQAQQHQAALVSRLQAKVLQYKQRCAELEGHMEDTLAPPRPPSALERDERERDRVLDLDTALIRLDDERRKSDKAMQLNLALRDQLEEAHQTNEALTSDLQKLSNDWEALREEMLLKEEEWKEEEQAFNEYYTTEHARLLNLWRDVVAVKRLFADMQASTQRDLQGLRSDMTLTTREMASACSALAGGARREASEDRQQSERELNELRTQLQALRASHEAAVAEVKHKDERVQSLTREVQALEERCGEAEAGLGQVTRIQEEVELLQGALRDIAHAVIQDAEGRDVDAVMLSQSAHVHLTPPGPVPPRSPKRGQQRAHTSPAFAEGTISAVQAALHKYQLHIHELQVKLDASQEQLQSTRRQTEASECSQQSLEARVAELTIQLDAAKARCNQLLQEKDILVKSLDSVRAEKNALDKNRLEINAMIDTLNADYEKVQKNNNRLQKLLDGMEDEKIFLQSELDRLSKDGEMREVSLRAEEDRGSRLREELLTVREELSRAHLAREVLEQHKDDSESVIAQMEKAKGDIELELERVLMERADLQEALLKAENLSLSLEADKKRLQDDRRTLEEERAALQGQVADQNSDLGSLRKELLQAEQTRLDLESDKVSLQEKCKFLDIEKEKTEVELGQVARERSDFSHQLAVVVRQKEALSEELGRVRQRLEQASETNSRLNLSLEDLVKDCEEKQVVLEANDKDIQRLQEQLASLRSEKEALEAVLFDAQTGLEATDNKRAKLEKENQELLVKHEGLKGQITRLTKDLENSEKRAREMRASLLQAAGNQEAEFQQQIAKLKSTIEETVRKLTDEREQVRAALEKRLQSAVTQLTNEKEAEVAALQERIDAAQQHLENVCQQHEEALLRAENDKQQSLLLAQHDQQALQEKLECVRRELEEERGVLERVRREATARAEQDRATLNQLRDELARVHTRLEDFKCKAEEDRARFDARADELLRERDLSQQESEELKVQLSLSEDRVDQVQAQLQETLRKLKETENVSESLRKDLTDVRRQLSDCSFEKDKYCSTNRELREIVKRLEGDKREAARGLDEAVQKIAMLEEARGALDLERTRLQAQVRDLEHAHLTVQHNLQTVQDELARTQAANKQAAGEEKELQARLAVETEERERASQELHQLRKQAVELDGALEMARQEMARLRSRAEEEGERWRAREQELVMRLEDSRNRERKLEDQKHNLEVCLADATQQIQELKARLGGAEGRVRALDQQLLQLEAAKKDADQKLSSVGSTLRRIAGIQLDGSVSLPFRLLSPSRRWSPARVQEHHDGRGDSVVDVDPEVIRKGVRSLMQQVAQIERERDDLKAQVTAAKKQLAETQEHQSKGDTKLNATLQNLSRLQEEKGSLENRLGQKQAALQAQSETLQQRTEEATQLRERLTALELTLHSGAEERAVCEDKLDKVRAACGRLEAEKRALQEELGRTESRATKLELQRMGLEGDLQRLQMVLQEKDSHLAKLQERCEQQGRMVASLEERCASMKNTIDQLNLSLERAAAGESELRAEIQSLQRTLIDTSSTSQASCEKLKQLQKSLTNSENERRVVTERLEVTQQQLADLRRANQQLSDQSSRLHAELANNEVQRSALESQLRLANSSAASWPAEQHAPDNMREEELNRQLTTAHRERSDLRTKVDSLVEKVRCLETEKRTLERTITKGGRSRSYDRNREATEKELDMVDSAGSGLSQVLEQENRELRMRVRRLEAMLAEKENELLRARQALQSAQAHLQVQQSHGRSHSPERAERAERAAELERVRASQLQAERLLEAREQSHRQQVLRLENQIQLLREQLAQEVKRRQLYVLRSSRAGREMQHLRQALGDSLRTVSQDPALDALLLEHEARKLDNSLATATSPMPPK